ncbi:hypothetical protein CPB83DRAFT_864864 [Crepidotus variabilis]|uniref:Uncharacterized protein n=1 Tax=Crepidotus variabilis TaxID=179855 RepID=A0A9P6JIL2_9AGAR|nr:hypothetical protein CPB83DRAFT_864864 [Crepidotus variabilis]
MLFKNNIIAVLLLSALAAANPAPVAHADANPAPLAEAAPQKTPTACPTCSGLLASLQVSCCRDAGCNGYLHCNPTCTCVNGQLVGKCNCHYN